MGQLETQKLGDWWNGEGGRGRGLGEGGDSYGQGDRDKRLSGGSRESEGVGLEDIVLVEWGFHG